MKILSYLVILLFFFSCESKSIKFNSEVWRQSKHCKPVKLADMRYQMINDLTQNILVKKNKEEVIELLGESLPKNVLKEYQRDLIYCLGRSHSMTMQWLIISFDENNKLSWKVIRGD